MPTAWLSIQLPVYAPREAAEDGLSTWAPATHLSTWETWMDFQALELGLAYQPPGIAVIQISKVFFLKIFIYVF